MKKISRLLGIVLLVALIQCFGVASAFASEQEVPATTPDADNASITINNPANGETYSVFKLFDATVSADGKISYQGTVPSGLEDFFEADAQGNIIPKDVIVEKDPSTGKVIGTKMTDELKAALETWAGSASAAATADSDGSKTLKFTGLAYGYYVMTTSHEDDTAAKALISVDSTIPNATIYDKNETKTVAKEKKVFDANGTEISSVTIGQEVTYVAKFETTNYVGAGEDAQQVYKYVITDTLPEYMTGVQIQSVTVGGTALTTTPQFDADGKFEIAWTNNGDSLYANGAEIVVTYKATITSTININATSKNTISIQPFTDDDTPYGDPWTVSRDVNTYAAAIKKVDEKGEPLKGAQFTIKGLTVTGSAGLYTVASYDPASTAAESAPLDTDDEGMLYIVGLAENTNLTVTEYKAPNGYNKLAGTKTLTPQVLSTTIYTESGTNWYDADGNLVSSQSAGTTSKTVEKNLNELDAGALVITNQAGIELPSTGGIGTTIFYVVGAILIIGAGVVLFTKRRARKNDKEQ